MYVCIIEAFNYKVLQVEVQEKMKNHSENITII